MLLDLLSCDWKLTPDLTAWPSFCVTDVLIIVAYGSFYVTVHSYSKLVNHSAFELIGSFHELRYTVRHRLKNYVQNVRELILIFFVAVDVNLWAINEQPLSIYIRIHRQLKRVAVQYQNMIYIKNRHEEILRRAVFISKTKTFLMCSLPFISFF